ncbi:3-deoxy-8-phosphooctulonate synthase [Oceanicola sp. D3]|uniref:3-deoxy-8-phosphooctulonate synthase n=1 Tax=Oceanicola sp. D3 TaxID=2587163 RepID=UPI001122CE5E|nr:3-deoxy-8-phosphooctulonate synthase [Oceanicola sp. D3]QDC09091.1 3-deoxy-8-phosphooctulonate synthase [Oceanicola sp. D3]
MKSVELGSVTIANDRRFALLAGPCQLESLDHARMLAEKIGKAAEARGVPFIFKASYDKANRTSLSGKRGLGIEKGLEVLAAVREEFGCPVVTDVHDVAQAKRAGEVVDILQIPAFLCRQTDLLLATGETGCAVNVKKGQFLAPWDMGNVAQKIASTGNERIMLCERGTSFGYNALVSDFRSLPIMAETGYPVVFDATHSVQQPGGLGGSTGGKREYVPVLAAAAMAVGCAAVFMEVHEDPDNAPSDGPNMLRLEDLPAVLDRLVALDDVTKG